MKSTLGIKATLVLMALALGLIIGSTGWPGAGAGAKQAHGPAAKEGAGGATKIDLPAMDQYGDPLPVEAIARLGTTRFFGGVSAWQVIYSSDGNRLLVSNWQEVIVFDAKSGKRMGQIRPANNLGVNCMSLSPNGQLLAVGTTLRDGKVPESIQIFDVATNRLLRECKDIGRHQYLEVRFSPDGAVLGSYSYPGKAIYLWDPATGQEVRRWPVKGEYGCFTFSQDGKTIIAGDGTTIYFRDIASGAETRRIEDHPGPVRRLTISPDGKTLASQRIAKPKDGDLAGNNRIYFWDAASGKKLRQIQADAGRNTKLDPQITDFEFLADGKSLLTAGADGTIRTWDVEAGRELKRWETGEFCRHFAVAPNGQTLAFIGGGNTIRFWDMKAGREAREHPGHRHGFRCLAISPDGSMIASGNRGDVRLWDTNTGRQQGLIKLGTDWLRGFYFSAGGRTLVTLDGNNVVAHWDTASGKKVRQFRAPVEGRYTLHARSADEKTFASVFESPNAAATKIVLWDAGTGKKLRELIRDIWWIGALGFSPDNRRVFSYSGEQKVFVWNAETGKVVRDFAAGMGQVYTGSFSADGKWFVCGGRRGELLLYDMATGNEMLRLGVLDMRDDYPCFVFTPDGRTLAVGVTDGSIHMLELATGKFRHHVTGGHQGAIYSLVFTPDGRRLISGSADTTALVWDLTGRVGTKAAPLSVATLESCWADLKSDDAARAYQAIRRLAGVPTQAVPFFNQHLKPVEVPDDNQLKRLITDLSGNVFARRDEAMRELKAVAELAESALRQALAQAPPLEARQRIAQLLARIETIGASGEHLRQTRALEVLENIGTPAARQLLHQLAGGAPEALLTREAKGAGERLAKRTLE